MELTVGFDLGNFRLGQIPSQLGNLSDSLLVNFQHQLGGLRSAFSKEAFQDIDDEVHGRKVIVVHQDAPFPGSLCFLTYEDITISFSLVLVVSAHNAILEANGLFAKSRTLI
jgi:hypothetical protein|tara:strand:- start:559 stop:894 length:336 start_codon:yes stop_codon:yes gene_type:complete